MHLSAPRSLRFRQSSGTGQSSCYPRSLLAPDMLDSCCLGAWIGVTNLRDKSAPSSLSPTFPGDPAVSLMEQMLPYFTRLLWHPSFLSPPLTPSHPSWMVMILVFSLTRQLNTMEILMRVMASWAQSSCTQQQNKQHQNCKGAK